MKWMQFMAVAAAVGAGVVCGSAAPVVWAAEPNVNVSPVVLEGLSSTNDHGVVKVMSDPTLSDGRLVLKVVAFNRNTATSSFGPDAVKIFTAAGQPIPLMTLDQLLQETQSAAGGSARGRTSVDTYGTSGPTITHDAAGRPDVGNYTAGSNSLGSSVSTRDSRGTAPKADDPKMQQQIAALSAAILQPAVVPPAAAVGGQVVTQKIKFARKEGRALRVVVEFNGEEHVFEFDAPGEK